MTLLDSSFSRRHFLKVAGLTALAPTVLSAAACSLFGKTPTKSAPTTASFVTRPELKPPLITVKASGQLGDGLVFMTANGPLMVDNRGSPTWYQPAPTGKSVADFKVQQYQGHPVLTWWQGTVMSPGFGRGQHNIMNAQYEQIGTIQAGNSYQADLHDLQLTPEGTALLTAYNRITADLTAVGGSSNGKLMDCILQEIDLASGRVLLEWHSRDHVSPSESYVAAPKNGTQIYDYFHLNSIDVGTDGNLLISARNTWALYKLDRKTGAVIWRLAGKQSDFKLGTGVRFAMQHDPRWHGGGVITLFDDGAGPPNVEGQSRGLRLLFDEPAKMVTVEREFVHSSQVLATSQGNLQALDNGNVFVGWGSQPYFSEYNSSGQQIFDGQLATNQSYRAFRLPWTGAPTTHPSIAAIDHQTLSFDAYDKFIEDDFLNGQRIDPRSDGRPDPRPDVRENVGVLGDLTHGFDFNAPPRPPLVLPVHPTTTLN